ncbi:hypothetical protein J6590_029933 [Homalodisca vitripennis]|nr:hypothetical protein J6590_029933 [Homalodisca vitripennis]
MVRLWNFLKIRSICGALVTEPLVCWSVIGREKEAAASRSLPIVVWILDTRTCLYNNTLCRVTSSRQMQTRSSSDRHAAASQCGHIL